MVVFIIQGNKNSQNRFVREEHGWGSDGARFHKDCEVTANKEGGDRDRHRDRWNGMGSPQTNLSMNGQLISNKGAQAFQEMVLGHLNSLMQEKKEKELRSPPHTIRRSYFCVDYLLDTEL